MVKDEKVDRSLYSNNDIITMNKEGMAEIGCAFFDVPVGIGAVYPPRNPILFFLYSQAFDKKVIISYEN